MKDQKGLFLTGIRIIRFYNLLFLLLQTFKSHMAGAHMARAHMAGTHTVRALVIFQVIFQ